MPLVDFNSEIAHLNLKKQNPQNQSKLVSKTVYLLAILRRYAVLIILELFLGAAIDLVYRMIL